MNPRSWAVTFVVSLSGCATVQVSGVTVLEGSWQRDSGEVRSRASFDLGCASEELKLTLLSTQQYLDGTAPAVIGVSGCEKKATYVRVAVDRYHKVWTLERAAEATGAAK